MTAVTVEAAAGQPLGPNRSTRIRSTGTPSSTSIMLADSAKDAEPQTKQVASGVRIVARSAAATRAAFRPLGATSRLRAMKAPDAASSSAVGQVGKRTRGDSKPQEVRAAEMDGVSEHGDQRDHTRTAGDAEGGGVARPDEPAADRATEIELVPHLDDVGEVGRDLAVLEPFDIELDEWVRGRGRHGVGALGRVAVLGRQPDDVVLPWPVVNSVGDLEPEPDGPRCRMGDLADRRPSPAAGGRLLLSHPGIAARARGRRGRGSR